MSCVGKNTAGFHNLEDIAKGIELVGDFACQVFDGVRLDVDFQFVAGLDDLVELFRSLIGDSKTAIDAVAVKNSRV